MFLLAVSLYRGLTVLGTPKGLQFFVAFARVWHLLTSTSTIVLVHTVGLLSRETAKRNTDSEIDEKT